MADADVGDLAAKLYRAKRRVYRRSLLDLATRLGYRLSRPTLSEEVDAALHAEADDHARRIADTYNSDLTGKADELALLPNDKVEPALRTWAVARQRARATPTAITEAYSAHADATVAAFLDLGLPEDVTFDFGGHPELGDAPAACAICQALVRHNPHPLDRVVAVGNPHPGCRQDWHINFVQQRNLPLDPRLGQTLAGIVGRDSLITRAGGRDEAVAQVEALASE